MQQHTHALPGAATKRVAVVGSGISGLAAAWTLAQSKAPLEVHLFEAGSHFGGHANTVDLELQGERHGVDTGFLVFNHRTYPGLKALFESLEVPTAASEMSFSVQVPKPDGSEGLEWSGNSLATVFAQRRNALSPSFLGMLAQIARFNRMATALAQGLAEPSAQQALEQPIGQFLGERGFGERFTQHYLLPMVACIWSCSTQQMLSFPMATLVRFCHNHGLLQVNNRPQWYTVQGGSRNYVNRLLQSLPHKHLNTPVLRIRRLPQGVMLQTGAHTLTHSSTQSSAHTPTAWQHFDAAVLACHSDQALRLLGPEASRDERKLLGDIGYQDNVAVLHTDASVMPRRTAAWAAWNYERSAAASATTGPLDRSAHVCLHYWLNRLQPLPWQTPVFVSLNPKRPIDERLVHQRIHYSHPVFDLAAIRAQSELWRIQGQGRIWFAGAWCGYGFHEDGLVAGQSAARGLLQAQQQWAAPAQLEVA